MTPLVVEFRVEASPTHAFDVWTRRCELWWPSSHTITGQPSTITFEPHTGGRIFERSVTGEEHDWGWVVEWSPPTLLRYRWHLFFDPSEATDVAVTFTAQDEGTAVRLEQGGWERLGLAAEERRNRTEMAWTLIAERYATTCRQDA